MHHGADELAVLNDRRAGHKCVQVGTTHFCKFLTVSTLFVKENDFYCSFLVHFATQMNVGELFSLIF